MSIIIAEDNRVAAKLLEMQLAALGFRTTTVASGGEVLEVVRSCADVELLITDLEMPGMSGVDVIRTLRHDPRWCRLPIVVATGNADVQHARQVASLQVHHYLVKPVHRAQLESTVRAALAERAVALVSPQEVMQRLSVDEAGYRVLLESFLSLVDDALQRLGEVPMADGLPPDLPLRELEEAAELLNIGRLQALAARLRKADGRGAHDADAHERLGTLLHMVSGSLRATADAPSSAG
ncbi:response regulator [Candidatus Binatia bacterium]|nr:response regulator [Candidatus Binatia bacterium]